MNLTSKEDAFRFVMSEIWNEISHINSAHKATIEIECVEIGFKLHLRWVPNGEVFRSIHSSNKITLTELGDANFSMTSWLRQFISESGIHGDFRDRPKTL